MSLGISISIVGEARSYLFSDLAVAIILRADLTIVTLLLGREAASVYAPALSMTNREIFTAPQAVYLLITPLLARLRAEESDSFWLNSVGTVRLTGGRRGWSRGRYFFCFSAHPVFAQCLDHLMHPQSLCSNSLAASPS